MHKNTKKTTLWLCTTAMFMALNVIMSSFGVPVPGGHLYMNDIIICTAAILIGNRRRRLQSAAWARFWETCCSIPRRCSSLSSRTACRRS